MSTLKHSLCRTLMLAILSIAGIAVIACAAIVVLTTFLHEEATSISESIGSVYELEEAQIALLRHGRERDQVSKQHMELEIRTRIRAIRPYIASSRERALVDAVDRQLESYFAVSRAVDSLPGERESQEARAYTLLNELVDLNVAEAARASKRAGAWDRLAQVFGVAVGLPLLALAVGTIYWLRRRAFQPLFSLAATMRRFGSGDHQVRAREHGPVEVRDMSHCFNDMAGAMADRRQAQIAFLGGIAHDLRTPLTAITLAVEVLGTSQPLPPERRALDVIDRQITRLDRMLGDFLDMAKIEAGELEVTLAEHDARTIVRDAIDLFDVSAGARFRVSVPDAAVMVRADAQRLEQAITNLVSNAIKYSPPGTPIEVVLATAGNTAVLELTDHGIGMAAEEQVHIFEPFRRIERVKDVPGVGLGLFTVQRIVAAHRGRIEVDSAIGSGSSFRIVLPLAEVHPAFELSAMPAQVVDAPLIRG